MSNSLKYLISNLGVKKYQDDALVRRQGTDQGMEEWRGMTVHSGPFLTSPPSSAIRKSRTCSQINGCPIWALACTFKWLIEISILESY